MDLTFRQLQQEQAPWAKHNFPNNLNYHQLLGLVEEVGELAHAHLKMDQNIRGTKEEHMAEAKDAIGDIIVFLSGYCNLMGIDFQDAVETAWNTVKQRDFVKFPRNGRTE